MSRLTLFLLGPPRIELNDTPVDLQRRKAMALLIYLAVTGQPHSRDALATLFWPDHSQSKARAYLRRDLAVLNTSLTGDWLIADRDTVELRQEADFWLDVAEFRRLLAEGQNYDHLSGDLLVHLTEAIHLYTGDFLAGFSLRDSAEFDDWQFFQAESLRQELAEALERVVQGYLSQDQAKTAIPHARRWVGLDPLHEPAQRALIRLYDQAGQPSAALRQYEEYVALLEEELGLPPEEETTTLYEAIKAKRMLGSYLKSTEKTGQGNRDKQATLEVDKPASQKPTSLVPPIVSQPAPGLSLPVEEIKQTKAGGANFVAREQEMDQLNRWLAMAIGGQHRVIFVTGEAGQGKTTLLQAFARQAQEAQPDLMIAGGNCNAYTGQGDPYLPFREILEFLTGEGETGALGREQVRRVEQILPALTQTLVETGPNLLNTFVSARRLLNRTSVLATDEAIWLSGLQKLVARLEENSIDTDIRQQNLFEQFARVIRWLTQQAPLLLLLDDLQWIDLGSTNLLFHLSRQLRDCRVLIVGAYRPTEVALGRPSIEGAGQMERHPLEWVINELQRDFGDISLDLGQAEGRAFVDGLLDAEPNRLAESFRQTLYQQTQGHPLFTIELLRGMQERGDLSQDDDGYWVEQPQLDWQRLPARVEGAIGERIDRLPPALRELLQVASVEGEEFTAEVVARVLDVDPHLVVRQLSRELDKRHQLVQAQGLKREGALRLSRYRFRHILIQRYLYQSLDEVERVHLNEAIGRAFEVLYGKNIDPIAVQLARHYQEAGLLEKAVSYLLQAGTRARRLSANEEAITHYTQALTLLETLPDTAERAQQELEVRIALGPALMLIKGHSAPEVEQTYTRAYDLGQRTYVKDPAKLFPILWGLWRFNENRGNLHVAYELAQQCLALAQTQQNSELLIEAHVMGINLFLGEFTAAHHHFEQIKALYDPDRHHFLPFLYGGIDPQLYCVIYEAFLLWIWGYPDQSRQHSQMAVDLARASSDPYSLAYALCHSAIHAHFRQDGPAIYRLTEEAVELCREQGFSTFLATAIILQGWAQVKQGQAEGLDQLQQGLAAYLDTTARLFVPYFRALLAEVYWQLGRIEEGLTALAEAQAMVGITGERFWEAELYRLKGELWLAVPRDEVASPADWFLKAVDIARQQGARSLELRAIVSLSRLWHAQGAQDKQEEARRLLEEIYGWFSEGFETVDLQEAKALLEELGGKVEQGSSPSRRLHTGAALPGGFAQEQGSEPVLPLTRALYDSGGQLTQQIRYCTTPDNVRLAYATVGSGPPLVKAANWLNHLEHDWQSPVWRHWLEGLAQHHTLIRYDKRGCGLSDRLVDDFSLEAQVVDLETVVDTLELDRFPLFGLSGGGPIAIAYAARHPERVSQLILCGSYSRGRLKRSQSLAQVEEAQMLFKVMEVGWGKANPAFRQLYTGLFIPEGTVEQIHWFNELQRVSTSPELAVRMFIAASSVDVSDLASQVTAPTLVLHGRQDAVAPFEEGQRLARLLPNARFVPLESKNHILLEHEPAWSQFLAEVHQFLQVEIEQPAAARASRPGQTNLTPPVIPPKVTDAVFVAREQELAQLEAVLQTALSGQSRVVFITGEAGQGKSALLRAFAHRTQLARPDLIVAGGTCNAYTGTGDPYLPFREILELLTGAVEAQTAAGILPEEQVERLRHLWPQGVQTLVDKGADLLDTFVPAKALLNRVTTFAPRGTGWLDELQALANDKLKRSDRPTIQQVALFEQYTRVIQALSRQAPLLLLLDDLQWADTGSTNLLFHLGRRLGDHPVLMVGAYRPADVAIGRDGERHPLEFVINEFQRHFGNISLNLAQAEGEKFVNALLDSEPNQLSASFRAALFQLTGGHPLFTIELLRGMQERGELVKDEAGRWVEQPQLDWTALPPRVEGAIGARISRLEPAMQNLLQIASVEGEIFTAEVVAQVLQGDTQTVIHQLSQVLDRIHQLVRPEGIKHEGELHLSRYRFRHILIQRYLYQSLDVIERVHHHKAVSQALETLYDQQVGQIVVQLAHHYSAANVPEKARIYLHQAGDQARYSVALAEAGHYYQAALALWPETEQAERAGLLRKLGECQWVLGQLQDALTNFEASYSLNKALNNQKEAGAIQLLIGRLYWEQGNRQESLRHHHQALAILEELPESVELARAFSAISQLHMLAAEYDQAISRGEQALDLASRLGAEAVTAHAMLNLGDASFYTGQQERGLSLMRDSLQRALSLGLPHDACRAYMILGEGLASDGRYSEAQATFTELESYASRVGVSLFAGSAVVENTKILWLTGQWQAALSNRQKILDWDRQGQLLSYLQVISGNLFGQIYNDLGRAEQAWQVLQETITRAQGQDELQAMGPHLAQSARALDGLGRKAEARAHLHRLLALIKPHQYDHVASIMPLLFSCRWFAAQAANDDESLDEARTSLQLLERLFNQTTSSVAEVALNEGRGIVATAEGNPKEAIRYYRAAAGGWQKLGRPYDQAQALHDLAMALARSGQTGEARVTVDWAISILDVLASQLEDTELRIAFLNAPLWQQIRQMRSELDPASILPLPGTDQVSRHNLPAQPTEFIGREKELVEIRRLLVEEPTCRLLTLLGPGGIGKTRLALEVAAQVNLAFPDGVYFVSLAPLDSAEHIVAALAEALHFRFYEGDDPTQQLLDHLHSKQALLVLDNFEHMEAGPSLIGRLLQNTSSVKMLITSRERLNLSGETLYTLNGLAVPRSNQDKDILAFDAAKLFIQQARLIRPDADPLPEDQAEIARICQLTQGMPLALVLAAGWLEVLSFKEIAGEISRGLDFLETEVRDVPERQRSIRAVFESSWQRLSPQEQQIFMKLSVFRGGFTRPAAQTVAGADMRTLRQLVNKSLISGSREHRYEVHELLRQYGETKLVASTEAESTRAAHLDYYLDLLDRHKASIIGLDQREILDEIEDELENIRVAWNRAIDCENIEAIERSLETLFQFYWIRSRFQEGEQAFGRAATRLQAVSPAAYSTVESVLVRLIDRHGAFCYALSLANLATTQLQTGLELARRLDDKKEIAFALNFLGEVTRTQGKFAAAVQLFKESLSFGRAIADPLSMAHSLKGLGWSTAEEGGDYRQAKQYYAESLTYYRAAGHQAEIAFCLDKLAYSDWQLGDYAEAERLYRESLASFKAIGDQLGVAKALGGLALVVRSLDDEKLVEAKSFAEESLAACRETGHKLEICNRLLILGMVQASRGELDQSRQSFQDALELSTKIDYEIGQTLALNGLGEIAWRRKDFQKAREYLIEALSKALPTQRFHDMAKILINYAALLIQEPAQDSGPGKDEKQIKAFELLTLAINHPNTWQDTRDEAGRFLTALESKLPPEALSAARAHSQTRSLEQAAREILPLESVSAPSRLLPIGQRFVEEELIATGGMGKVYRGRDTRTGQPVAIKRLRPDLLAFNPEVVQRFMRESETLRQLNHPNIVKMLDTFENEGQPVIVMEYIPGGTLEDLLNQQPHLPLERVLTIALELADALARVHHRGILHRDLKPANVLLAEDGTPRLTDFGVAYLARPDNRLTQEGAILGTSAYLSPEAWRGETLDARSDIWSFGALLYELLAGRPPFAGEQAVAIMTAILNDPLPELAQFRPETPPALVGLIKQMLVKARDQRIDSMRQVAAGLEVIQRSLA